MVVESDYIEKAEALPPMDPEGTNTLHPDLVLTKEDIVSILENTMRVVSEWLMEEKEAFHQKTLTEGRTL